MHGYKSKSSDVKTHLYPGSTNFTLLSVVFNTDFEGNGWSDKSLTKFLLLLKEKLQEGNTLPNRNYETKNILCPMGMEYKKIHVCPNDCILYKKEFEFLKNCIRVGYHTAS